MAGAKQDSARPEESKLYYNLAATVSQNCRSLIGIRVKIFTDQVRLLDQAAVIRSVSYDEGKHHLLRAILLRDGVKQSKWKFKMVFAMKATGCPIKTQKCLKTCGMVPKSAE